MKTLILLLCGAMSLCAEDAEQKAAQQWQVKGELQAITMPEKTALALLPALSDDTTIVGAWKQIEGMLTKGEARVTAVVIAKANSGDKAEARQGEEVRYPIEFEVSEGATAEAGQAPDKVSKPAPDKKGPQGLVGMFPTTFEKRNTGVAMVMTPLAVDAASVQLLLEASHTWFLGWEQFEAGQVTNGDKVKVPQPKLSVAETKSSFHLRTGERVLLSIHRVPGETGKMELFIFRAEVKPQPK